MREIMGYSVEDLAQKAEITAEEYLSYESGKVDLPFTFIYKCANIFGVQMTELLEGRTARLRSYTVTRRNMGQNTAIEDGIVIQNLAPEFQNKLAEPYYVRYEYSPELQGKPIHLTKHNGQEFDIILEGSLLVQVGEHKELLEKGDSIFYDSSTPHGMIAVGGKDCVFCAVVLAGEQVSEKMIRESVASVRPVTNLICEKYIDAVEDEYGALKSISFKDYETFNFGFDIVDKLAEKYPDKLALLYLDREKNEKRFTFSDIKKESARCANYLKSLGIRKGDKVMLTLKRHYQFWFAMIALHKLGAIAVPATYQLKQHDFEYRFQSADVSAIICTSDGDTAEIAEAAAKNCPTVKHKIIVGAPREGWRDFNSESAMYSSHFSRAEGTPGGDDVALMFFSSGTTGNPKMVEHRHTYALGHYVTARYWHCCERDGLHFTISDTGWGKSLWGKLYGQWLCEGAVFVYDFDRFDPAEVLPLFKQYGITTFCAPPTILRMMIRQDISKYDFSSLRHMTTAGEAVNPEVIRLFREATGLDIYEGFGQTETTLTVANLVGTPVKEGSMGKPSPQYDVVLLNSEGKLAETGEVGEICINVEKGAPLGLFKQYFKNEKDTNACMHDGYYHTGDTAWRDEDGYFWYVGRVDDIIKSSGYRIGPFEIESIIMELPYVLECGVSAAPDEIRGQIVKASIVLTKGTEPTEELKKEIQNYVKQHTAPYKYPRLVVFRDSLPKSISGKIQRNKL
ncbi:MAG: AMP-binding protein [Clostridia bacterium]|nr:AMP-binding protein [Clostridia bacterium]